MLIKKDLPWFYLHIRICATHFFFFNVLYEPLNTVGNFRIWIQIYLEWSHTIQKITLYGVLHGLLKGLRTGMKVSSSYRLPTHLYLLPIIISIFSLCQVVNRIFEEWINELSLYYRIEDLKIWDNLTQWLPIIFCVYLWFSMAFI